ncbi:MAG TPA: radical SAM protein [Verrucomicrobiota bacterium]|nr:radical SAM protein [Verrucomicrobiota bacterium]HNU49660.1 radical SAM protein [Verrucomicrobiota bacterium]
MKRLMLFIEPTAAQVNIFSQFTLPRLGSFILAGLVNRRGSWRARVFVEGRRRFDLAAWMADHGRPEVVGISTITPTVKRGYALADECRALGLPVILGGPHVTFLPDEALAHAPLVVRGEGESAMNALLDLWNDGHVDAANPRYAAVPNLSWKDAAGTIQHNPLAPWIMDLDALPVPDFALADGTAECLVGGKKTVMVQTSRGCPFDCSFCSVTGMFGKRFRYRSVGSILDEFRRYDTREHFIFFCDDNFTANRRRARELLEAMRTAGFRFQWSTQVRTDVGSDPDLVRLMKSAGCHTVFVGFESVNPRSLAEMKKGQSLDDTRLAIRVIQQAGIHIHGMFVFGFEGDDRDTVEATVRFAQQTRLTSVQLLILTPLPGSELYEHMRAEGRITSFDWDLYDTHHVVFRPALLTPLELQQAQVRGHQRLYSLPECLRKLVAGRWVSAGLSLYGWKTNRDWQKANQPYLRTLAAASPPAGADRTSRAWRALVAEQGNPAPPGPDGR